MHNIKEIIVRDGKSEKDNIKFYETPNFSERALKSTKEIHHKPYNIRDSILLCRLGLLNPWDLDMLISKGIFENLAVEDEKI